MIERYKKIETALDENDLERAFAMVEAELHMCNGNDAMLHYLHGRAFMKRSNWGAAVSAFLKAESIDPESPAVEARRMLNDILAFYHKDSYNP